MKHKTYIPDYSIFIGMTGLRIIPCCEKTTFKKTDLSIMNNDDISAFIRKCNCLNCGSKLKVLRGDLFSIPDYL